MVEFGMPECRITATVTATDKKDSLKKLKKRFPECKHFENISFSVV